MPDPGKDFLAYSSQPKVTPDALVNLNPSSSHLNPVVIFCGIDIHQTRVRCDTTARHKASIAHRLSSAMLLLGCHAMLASAWMVSGYVP